MKVAIFSSKPYERAYFEKFNHGKHDLVYFDTPLNVDTTNLAIGFRAVCVFVTDQVDRETIQKLSDNGVKMIEIYFWISISYLNSGSSNHYSHCVSYFTDSAACSEFFHFDKPAHSFFKTLTLFFV